MKLFSILHPSVRPNQWKRIRDLWLERAHRPHQVEYLLGYHRDQLPEFGPTFDTRKGFSYAFNDGPNHPTRNNRSSLVDNVNMLAKLAAGAVLIEASDDQEAPIDWDLRLLETIRTPAAAALGVEFVVKVSTGTPNDTLRADLMTIQILSRPRYERFGYVFHPRYTGMYADNEFSEVAHRDGVVIDAKHLVFQHKHPYFDPGVEEDRWYQLGNAPHEYALGRAAYVARKACGFPPDPNWKGEY